MKAHVGFRARVKLASRIVSYRMAFTADDTDLAQQRRRQAGSFVLDVVDAEPSAELSDPHGDERHRRQQPDLAHTSPPLYLSP